MKWNLPGWKIERENVLEEARGTIDPRFVHVLIAERKAGLTVHLWNPVDYYWLDTQKEALQRAGFKVMRGCVQFNRKQPFPFDTMESVSQDDSSMTTVGKKPQTPAAITSGP